MVSAYQPGPTPKGRSWGGGRLRCPLQKRGLFRMAPATQGAPNVRMSTIDTSTARDFAFMIGTTLISRPRLDLSPHSRWDMARAGETPCTVKTLSIPAPAPPTLLHLLTRAHAPVRPPVAPPTTQVQTAPWRNPMHREDRPTSQHRRRPAPPHARNLPTKTPCTYPRPQSVRPPAHGKTAPRRNPMHRENRGIM